MAKSNTTLKQAKEKVDPDLKTAQAVAEKDQAEPAEDKLLDLTEQGDGETVIEYLNNITKEQSVRFKNALRTENWCLTIRSVRIVRPFIANAFGSTDMAFVGSIVAQLANAVSANGKREGDLQALKKNYM